MDKTLELELPVEPEVLLVELATRSRRIPRRVLALPAKSRIRTCSQSSPANSLLNLIRIETLRQQGRYVGAAKIVAHVSAGLHHDPGLLDVERVTPEVLFVGLQCSGILIEVRAHDLLHIGGSDHARLRQRLILSAKRTH